jgi:hypothetical protein
MPADIERRSIREQAVRENRSAARNPALDPTDPRWVLAVRAASQLENGTLTPERRERVMRTARLLGVRPFDANVIIAIAQDHARRGVPLGDAADLIAMTGGADGDRRDRSTNLARWLAALTAAAVLTLLLVRWIVGT